MPSRSIDGAERFDGKSQLEATGPSIAAARINAAFFPGLPILPILELKLGRDPVEERYIQFPAVCPSCGADALVRHRLKDVLDALFYAKPLRLTSVCHGTSWRVGETELYQIRDYVRATLLHDISYRRGAFPTLDAVGCR